MGEGKGVPAGEVRGGVGPEVSDSGLIRSLPIITLPHYHR